MSSAGHSEGIQDKGRVVAVGSSSRIKPALLTHHFDSNNKWMAPMVPGWPADALQVPEWANNVPTEKDTPSTGSRKC